MLSTRTTDGPANGDRPTALARLYLAAALTAPSAHMTRVILTMDGEIRLGKRWRPFTSTLRVEPGRGFEWRAALRMGLLPVRGFDRYRDGVGEMEWRALGLIPVMTGSGPDITRSARHRAALEMIFCPAGLSRVGRTSDVGDGWLRVETDLDGEVVPIELALDGVGDITQVRMQRWGDPDGTGTYALHPFGGIVGAAREFHGVVIPTRAEVGWHFGTERFDEGTFFRAHVTAVEPAHDLRW